MKARHYPPGPIGLPLIGYVPFLGKFPSGTLWKLSKIYGDVFSFYVGRRLIVCVNDYKKIKEVLNIVLTRPYFNYFTGKGGFGGMNGVQWQEQRRFSMAALKSLAMSRGSWETMTREQASHLVKELQKKNGEPFSCEDMIFSSIANNLISLLFGRQLDAENEKESIEITQTFTKYMMDHLGPLDVAMNNPILIKTAELLNFRDFQKFKRLLLKFEAIFEREVNERVESKYECAKNDFIGLYLKEIENRSKTNKPHSFNLETLRGNLFIFLFAGQNSTSTTIEWYLLLMAKYPDVQKKVCAEIDRNLGRDGVVYYDDRVKLPYTTATLYEMLRFIVRDSLLPPRLVTSDFEFDGYRIPAGSHIVCNSWAMLHDPRYHEDPMRFKPERFLIENGTKLMTMDNYGLFSFGKRSCPGQGMAMMNLYLYFVSIMQKFTIKTPHGGPPDLEYKISSADVQPKKQNLCFIER
ncbi:hypothetical protein JTE90_023405 [Oedothorax gibbosus]|uniref:Cytochrome P450 n=1 Tax=Oedothorax gibbosus TaxID=931172 RepID=A0AAV6UFB1_9ARAC|nr:hypothetical protein JTE90_023405 [Oedothorax gibbosus]